jgi:hypothetical protein
VAVLSNTELCGPFFAGITGLNPAGDMDVFLLWMLRADPSSREVVECDQMQQLPFYTHNVYAEEAGMRNLFCSKI